MSSCTEGASKTSLEHASSCVIPTTWQEYPLLSVTPYNHNTSVFEFGLRRRGDSTTDDPVSLNLPVCSCILMGNVPRGDDETMQVRPYTPISDNSMLGKFQLLIKRYPAWGSPTFPQNYKPPGVMSNYIHNLKVGATVRFKHIAVNIKKPYPFTGIKTITMLAVGVGIAPMLQALHSVLTTTGDTTKVVLLYGNRAVADILMRERLEAWADKDRDRFKLVFCVGTRWKKFIVGGGTANVKKPPPPEGFEGLTNAAIGIVGVEGWINEQHVKTFAFPPANDTQVFVCGLPSVYDSLCGPRNEKTLTPSSVLRRLGYTEEMVFKF